MAHYQVNVGYTAFRFNKLDDAMFCFQSFARAVQIENQYVKKDDGTPDYGSECKKVGIIPDVSIKYVLDDLEYQDTVSNSLDSNPF